MIRQETVQNNVHTVDVSDSTSISSLIYESDAAILTVTFRRGNQKKYEFPGVGPAKFDEIKNSDSLGKSISDLKKEYAA